MEKKDEVLRDCFEKILIFINEKNPNDPTVKNIKTQIRRGMWVIENRK
ncbi:hypothetical protein [Bacillus phage vB_BceM_Bc431v3]|uniref:Uncharacterized protein n=1 Tax=Bacillus phage vB_BceM_Bc431v3 TaxID=1195072 RepID=M4HNP6_9CAUD|nr:hypothetical protein K201_gp148 [Bacillus phage vB_BceM_Bc431v3]AFQ96456.1 hypothetical protein [Bacillus phage vB_BceM_Bc431v3]